MITMQPDEYVAAVEERQLSESDSLRALIYGDRKQPPEEVVKMSAKSRWTPEEDRVIKENGHLGKDGVAELLPGRSASAVMNRAHKLDVSLERKDEEIPRAAEEPGDGLTAEARSFAICGEIEECRRDLAAGRCTPCGADPCGLIPTDDRVTYSKREPAFGTKLVPGLPSHDLSRELVDTNLRLIGAIAAAEGVAVSTQEQIGRLVVRCRELLGGY